MADAVIAQDGFTSGEPPVTGRRYLAAPGTEPSGVTIVLAHGAGAGMAHPFMVACATGLAARGLDAVTFNFPYMERRSSPPPTTADAASAPRGKAPNPAGDSLYVKMVSAYAKDSESKVRKRGPATIAGRQGFEAITDDGKCKFNHLVSIVPAGDRIYMLVSAGPRGHATSDDAERFRNSLHLTDGEPQTTGSTPPTPSP